MKRKTSLYVKDILDAISQIEKFTEGMEYVSFQKDDKTSSAVIRKLEILGEATKSIPAELRQGQKDIPWTDMARRETRLSTVILESTMT